MPKPAIKKVCKHCKSEFQTRHYETEFCSITCFNNHRKVLINVSCLGCGQDFSPRKSNTKFCSIACSNRYKPKRKLKTCSFCGKEIKGRGKKFCSSACCGYAQQQKLKFKGLTYQQKRAILLKRKDYVEWRTSVFTRDGYQCRICENKGYIEAHHIIPWANAPALRYNPNNGITLCKKCHRKVHHRGR